MSRYHISYTIVAFGKQCWGKADFSWPGKLSSDALAAFTCEVAETSDLVASADNVVIVNVIELDE